MKKPIIFFGAAIVAMGFSTAFAAKTNWVDANTNPAGNTVPSTTPGTKNDLSLGIGFGSNDIANPAQSKKAADAQNSKEYTPVARDLLPTAPSTTP